MDPIRPDRLGSRDFAIVERAWSARVEAPWYELRVGQIERRGGRYLRVPGALSSPASRRRSELQVRGRT